MGTHSPTFVMTAMLKSRPFLFCVILLLTGFLCFHYLEPLTQMPIIYPDSSIVVSGVNLSILPTRSLDGHTKSPEQKNKPKTTVPTLSRSNTQSNCKKKFDVSFLKVHKAGSTTVMNIFLRFAISHNLNIVLPKKADGFGFNYLGYGKTVSESRIVPLPGNEAYNILCNHVVYNKEAFREIMPIDTVYVGILREPKSHFVSAASYYGFYRKLTEIFEALNNTTGINIMSEYLKDPKQFNANTYFVYNRMSFDFGIPNKQFHNDSYVDSYIEELNKDYALVMLMERFEESLVLMKRLLCWDTKDILYVPLNAMKAKPQFTIADNDLNLLKTWNSADFKLYNTFQKRFNDKVAKQGDDFKEEVETFKNVQSTVKDFCQSVITRPRQLPAILTVPETKWDKSFKVTITDCRLMTEHELSMMRRLITDAWRTFRHSLNENVDYLVPGNPPNKRTVSVNS